MCSAFLSFQLYAQKFGSITGFKFLSDMILLSVVNKVQLYVLHHHYITDNHHVCNVEYCTHHYLL